MEIGREKGCFRQVMKTLDDDELSLSADAAVRIAWAALEQQLLEDLERWAYARGIETQQVARVVNLFSVWLHEIRAKRFETAKQMLKARATQIQ